MRRFLRDETGVHFDKQSPCYNQKDFVPLEVKAGSLVVIHGDLIHQRSVTFRTSQGPYRTVNYGTKTICIWITWNVFDPFNLHDVWLQF